MKNILDLPIFILLLALTMTSCNNSEQNMSRIDIETLDFSFPIDSLLQQNKFTYLQESSATSSPVYYSYDVDSFRYGSIEFSANSVKDFYQGKPEHLDGVFDVEEEINQIEIYPLSDSTIAAIGLMINNKRDAKKLLDYLGAEIDKKTGIWIGTSNDKDVMLHKQEWKIDDTEMITVNLYIIKKEAILGDQKIVSLFEEYVKIN